MKRPDVSSFKAVASHRTPHEAVGHSRRPKLGQHFLTDERYRRRIADALDLRPNELLIEIGAGRGAMTRLLAERARQVVAIELDAALAAKLQEDFRGESGVEVLQADILSTDLAGLCWRHAAEKCFVFGNLPYYITSPILDHVSCFWARIRAMALLVQHEVAERLAARPGRRAYGFLSVLAQLHFEPRILFRVPPGAFSPQPKVQSALVHFARRAKSLEGVTEDREKFLDFVKRCFAQKRKNLRNNLAEAYSRSRVERALDALELSPTLRAEGLSLEQFLGLYRQLD